MKYYEIFKAISAEYPEHIALAVIQIYTINLSTKLKLNGKFEQKIIKKSNKLLCEMSESDRELSVNLWRVTYEYLTRQSLQGLGGCEVKTFKQLLDE
jgi:hypothetical protein